MAENSLHTPVMLERTLELLAPALASPGAVLVDATLGLGGHAEAFLERFPELVLVGLDRDPHALQLTGERLAPFGDRVHLVHTVYDRIEEVLDELDLAPVAGILFDLGVSSMQLDQVERGFSYSKDAPLDMRMDDTAELTAARILSDYDEASLRRIFYEYGEEKLAPRYASRIVRERALAPLETSAQLVELLQAATPAALLRAGHPAKRVFQARSADGSACSRTSPSRTASSSGSWPRDPSRPPHAGFRSNFPSTVPSSGSWCAVPNWRARPRRPPTRARPPCDCVRPKD